MATERSLALAKTLWGFEPHSQGQRDWLLSTAKVKTACAGRRWGKSLSTAVDVVLYALEHPNSAQLLTAPTHPQTLIIFYEVVRRLYAIPGMAQNMTYRQSPYPEIQFHDGAGLLKPTTIMARTAGTDGKSLRGLAFSRAIVDEGAFISDKIMLDVITPLLADQDGDLVLISTPNGTGYFKQAYDRGLDPFQPRYQSFHFPSSSNPFLPSAYLENEQATKPERVYAQEYLADFQDDAGGVFRHVAQAVDKGRSENEAPKPGVRYFAGWDLARINDFSVLTILDASGKQVYLDRFQKMDWDAQITRVKRALDAYNGAPVVMDATGGLESVSQTAIKAGVKATPFVFTNTSKTAIMDNLALQIETKARLLDNPVQTAELTAYAYTLTASRNVTMNAPEGQHDDTVCALALAAHAASKIRYATAL